MGKTMSELAFASATELAAKIRDKEISAEELLQLYLQRVDKYNPALNAIIVDIRDAALTRAREIDAALARGEDLGPLAGVPMTVKESYNIAGTPTTCTPSSSVLILAGVSVILPKRHLSRSAGAGSRKDR